MLEKFSSENARDFRQRYQNVYGYYTTDSGRRILVYVDGVNTKSLNFYDKDKVKYTGLADTGLEFEFVPSNKRLFVYNKELYLVSRKPARHYQRGICEGNTDIICLSKAGIKVPISFELVESMEKPADIKKAMSMSTAALSNQFGRLDGLFYLYDEVIGEIGNNKVTLSADNYLFRQEVIDLFNYNGIKDWTVEVKE